jgi:uncharacterized protein YacL (UPF0231 family)
MKKILTTIALLLFVTTAFCQKEKKNGTIYIEHANITSVLNTTKAYLAKNVEANRKLYSAKATFWASGMEKEIPIEEAFKLWSSDFDFYDNITVTVVGYPDYLHYIDKDQKYVQSWWKWSGTSKKTGGKILIDYVQFDKFDADGKIINEGIYGDFSKMVKE